MKGAGGWPVYRHEACGALLTWAVDNDRFSVVELATGARHACPAAARGTRLRRCAATPAEQLARTIVALERLEPPLTALLALALEQRAERLAAVRTRAVAGAAG